MTVKIAARGGLNRKILPLLLLALLEPAVARAQAIPSAAEPSRANEQIAPLAPQLPPVTPSPASAQPQSNAPPGADKIVFTLHSLRIDGMTVYKESDISALYRDKIGKQITFADLYDIAAQLTVKYRNDGYILSQVVIPEQTIATGDVKLQAVEGFIDQVTVKGGLEENAAPILAIARSVQQTKPLNNSALERAALLINDLPGVSAHTVLAPSLQTPGAADLTVVADRRLLDFSLETDNRGSRYMGPLQSTGNAQFNDVLGLGEQLTVQAAGAIAHEMGLASTTWSQPLGSDGLRADANASITGTQPGYTLKTLQVRGVSKTASATLTQPFLRGRSENLWGYVKLDALNSVRDDNLGLGRTVDHVRALRLGSTWQFPDSFGGSDSAHAEFSKGLNLLNASHSGDPHLTRADGNPEFFKGTFEVTRAQQIKGPVSLYTAATGQKSADFLLASEEFGLGGASYGSAYDSSEITGEDGIAARAELRYDAPQLQGVQYYGFYDAGKIWNPDDAVPRHRQMSLTDTGVGIRFTLSRHFSGSFEIAQPLTREVATTQDKSPRVFFSLTARY